MPLWILLELLHGLKLVLLKHDGADLPRVDLIAEEHTTVLLPQGLAQLTYINYLAVLPTSHVQDYGEFD